ncbi:hypothetical protein SUGI_0220630 [Cryptomeria japonica]|uniref:probable inactive receptor kinase RLK902 n=1 Tax=Cryptomeria japonica TaxID=3369 RepID=UPI002408EBA6|nr:probable inactive receptor kinase RLK902 [Cryptomeria japonica]XP_057818039.2 probable inactive receptor kinase RLK902 [Cryptomeria japonica]XP_057818041.2 probable inactive receptor kinase RLK902 [Cryptomeria japonica]XP_057818042.2 probable inactive receptor kinase RLK902 [Cryptomeria japonica]GLJ13817.1 hypothetical protein SUGI_0220630 [Cryptomeria japonica]
MESWFSASVCIAVLLIGACGNHAVGEDLASDTVALNAFRQNVGRFVKWDQNTSACNWQGILCNGSRVTELRLPAVGLVGQILPGTLGNLTELRVLSLRFNLLSGPLPADLGKCTHMRNLYLQNNQFSGPIPSFISKWPNLVRLNLASNRFTGPIPSYFNSLQRLGTLYLENNSLNGSLPSLKLPNLQQFNVSFNKLNGSVPSGLKSFSSDAFLGNSLCGSPLPLCPGSIAPALGPSSESSSGSKGKDKLGAGAIVGIVLGSLAFLLVLFLIIFLCKRKRRSKRTTAVDVNTISKAPEMHLDKAPDATEDLSLSNSKEYSVTVQEPDKNNKRLVFFQGGARTFDLEDLLRASAEVLGKGSVGTAYKAVLEFGIVVAVKRLKDVIIGQKEFVQQIEVVGKMNHQNLVPLRAYYFSKDEKLLVYDYMPMGSLSALLHGNRGAGRTPLDWETRSRIALGAARGIEYLHGNGSQISHGNIKSSNILLTKDYNACVSDFGLAQLVSATPSASRIVGYRAPEVTDARRISQKADVYSFGVLLLELLTGKAPTHGSVNDDGVDLPRWVQSVVREEWTAEVFDIELLRNHNFEEDMVQLLQVAMDCVVQYPDQRPAMKEVVKRIQEVRRSLGDVDGNDHMSKPASELEMGAMPKFD